MTNEGLGAGRRSRRRRPALRFSRFCETRGLSEFVLYETVVDSDDFGAVFFGFRLAKNRCVFEEFGSRGPPGAVLSVFSGVRAPKS